VRYCCIIEPMTTVIFDVDGTLVDTRAAIYPAFREVIRHFPNQPQPAEEVIRKTLGNPDTVIWEMLLPLATEDERKAAFHLYQELVQRDFDLSQCLIPGVREMLQELHTLGYALTTASNCGEEYLNQVLDALDLRQYFTRPLCLESVGGTNKAQIIAEHLRVFPRDGAVMVGDRQVDVNAARANGIPAIGCAFGFGEDAELLGAATVVHHPSELPAAVKQLFAE